MAKLELIRDERPDARLSVPAQYVIRLREWVSDGEGRPLLTRRCPGMQELDTEIGAIKAELDQIQKDAHQRWGDH
jgi:hypothetical protein